MKEMQLQMGERYPLHINSQGIENLSYSFENLCLLREVKRPFPIVRCELSPYDLINVLGPFSVILQPRNLKVEFTNTSSGDRRARKITKIL